MEGTPRLYNELLKLLGQSQAWTDARHLQTLVWMIIGLICSGYISLTKWGAYMQSRALFAQSRQRRFSRWLHNPRINVQRLYTPIIKAALSQWLDEEMVLILDTTMLWEEYCLIRVCVKYRGRAVPVAWRVLTHNSASVALSEYQRVLLRVSHILPVGVRVLFLADRGFADTKLMRYLKQELKWHYRIRIKSSFWVWQSGRAVCQVKQFHLGLGEAVLLQGVKITKTDAYGLVHLALAHDPISRELWYIVSDEPTTVQTFQEYGGRFDIEENFLDDKSNGFQLERSLIRSATALSRLCLVLAIATLYLTAQGEQVVESGKRRWVDCHWHRGNSYLRLGWEWVKVALTRGWDLFNTLQLSGKPDPEPAIASRTQAQKQFLREFTVRSYNYAA